MPTDDRSQFIGSSDVAALFDAHPFMSRWELWQTKKGNLPPPQLDDIERVQWGVRLEDAIAHGLAAQFDWHVERHGESMAHPTVKGMQAKPDYQIVETGARGHGILEVKNVDWLQHKRWEADEPPLGYILQLQHQLACSGLRWGRVGYLIGGNESGFNEYEARPTIISEIEKRVTYFWESIKLNKPPPIDFAQDAELVAKLYSDVDKGSNADMTDNERLLELCRSYQDWSDEAKAAETTAKALKAEILTIVEDHDIVTCGQYRLKSWTVSGTPDRIITPEDVGTTLKGRAGHRQIRITEKDPA
jgi:putative phage-type endonuclease